MGKDTIIILLAGTLAVFIGAIIWMDSSTKLANKAVDNLHQQVVDLRQVTREKCIDLYFN